MEFSIELHQIFKHRVYLHNISFSLCPEKDWKYIRLVEINNSIECYSVLVANWLTCLPNTPELGRWGAILEESSIGSIAHISSSIQVQLHDLSPKWVSLVSKSYFSSHWPHDLTIECSFRPGWRIRDCLIRSDELRYAEWTPCDIGCQASCIPSGAGIWKGLR